MKTHLVFAVMTIALLAFVISQPKSRPFRLEYVIAQADRLSREPYKAREEVKSEALRNLNYDQYREIRWKEPQTLWRNLGLPFQVKFLLAGGRHHAEPVTFYQIHRDGAGQIRFSPDFFDYGKNNLSEADKTAGAFSGFRIHYPINKPDYPDEVLVFQGASYFRAVGKDQQWGLSARGLAINAGNEEEFPAFTTFWLVEPSRTDKRLTFYALLDGPSVTGAYEFHLEPGTETRVDVRAVLFFRKAVESAGLAPLTSMFWYGENTSNTFGNWRPEVHDSDGLLIHSGKDEWIWRPLAWAKRLQLNVFAEANPKGFGLLQHDRDFSHYQDLEAKYDQRPSLWVTPHGDWGDGTIKLLQFPVQDEYWDNVVAFWSPKKKFKRGDRVEFRYTLNWYAQNPERPPLGECFSTRVDSQQAEYYRMFVLDFRGQELSGLPENAPLQPDVRTGENARVTEARLQKNPNDNTWRVSFTASTGQLKSPIELACKLQLDGRPLTETWTYTWIP